MAINVLIRISTKEVLIEIDTFGLLDLSNLGQEGLVSLCTLIQWSSDSTNNLPNSIEGVPSDGSPAVIDRGVAARIPLFPALKTTSKSRR